MARTVLIVDDIGFVRKTLSDIFTKGHYQVVGEASNGREAIIQYFKLKPDVVTIDIVMPEMSGIEATQKIIKRDKDAKIIVISAMTQENLVMEAIHAGARDFIQKPFTSADILKSVEHVLVASQEAPQKSKAL